jgi:hypothetical protein
LFQWFLVKAFTNGISEYLNHFETFTSELRHLHSQSFTNGIFECLNHFETFTSELKHLKYTLSLASTLKYALKYIKSSTYTFAIDVSLMDTVDIAIHKPGEFDVPKYFQTPADWNTKEICLLTFTATHARLSNPDVPYLMNKYAHLRLFNLVSDF